MSARRPITEGERTAIRAAVDRAWCNRLILPSLRRGVNWRNLLTYLTTVLRSGAGSSRDELFGEHASLFFRVMVDQVALGSEEMARAIDRARRQKDYLFFARLSQVMEAQREQPIEKEPEDKLTFFLLSHWDRPGAFDGWELFYFTPDALAAICDAHFRRDGITTPAAINQRRRRLLLPAFRRCKLTVERRGGVLRAVPSHRNVE